MLPTERRQVLQQRVINGMAVATQRVRSPFQIDRVPQHDGSRYQIEAASPVSGPRRCRMMERSVSLNV